MSEFDLVAAPLATHALTVGAIGGLTLGMMTRTARGHTGRPLHADGWEIAAYASVTAAAMTRVLVPLALAEPLQHGDRGFRRPVVGRVRDLRRTLLAGVDASAP